MKKGISTKFSCRQYMLSDQFEVFYYEDIHLNHVVAHSHDYYELYFFLEGAVDYEIGDTLYPLQYGDFLLISPGLPHRPFFRDSSKPYRRFVLWIKESCLQSLEALFPEISYCLMQARLLECCRFRADSITFQDIQSRLIQLIEEIRDDKFCHETESRLLVASLLVCLNRILYNQSLHLTPSHEKELYLNLCGYVAGHLQEDLSLDMLASNFYVSKYHLCHIFKENMGISLHQYIIKKRLQASQNAILSGVPAGKVCQQYGFRDYTSFYRAFKKEFGLSPKEYLELHRFP